MPHPLDPLTADEIRRTAAIVRHDQEVGIAGQANMPDIEFAVRIEQIGKSPFSGERADSKRRDKMLAGCGENAAHPRSALPQAPDQIE